MDAWMNQSWWLYDATVLAIVILCVWNGWQHGVKRALIRLVCYGVAWILAWTLSGSCTTYVYERWVAPSCEKKIAQELEQSNLQGTLQQALSSYGISLDSETLEQIAESPDGAAQTLYSAAAAETGIPASMIQQEVTQTVENAREKVYGNLPDWMETALTEADSTESLADETAQTAALLLTGDETKAAKALTEQYIKPTVIKMLKSFTFSTLFLLISFVLQGIIKIFFFVKANRITTFDRLVGVTVGSVQAVVLLMMMGKFTSLLVTQGSDQIAFFNEAVIGKSVLFQMIYQVMK